MSVTQYLKSLSHGQDECLVLEVHIKGGQYIHIGDLVLTVHTDKATVEVYSDHEGEVESVVADPQSILVPGSAIFTVIDRG